MNANLFLIEQGKLIHDALRHFSKVSDKKWIYPNLEGGCAIGSYFLMKEAHRRGIDASLMVGYTHSWLESEGYIYDITASQYTHAMVCDWSDSVMDKATKVHILPAHGFHHVKWASRYEELSSCKGMSIEGKVAHINTYWPQGQKIKGYRLEWSACGARLFWHGKNKTIG